MKYLLLLLLSINAYADTLQVTVTGNAQTVIVNGVSTGIRHTVQNGALMSAIAEAQKCNCVPVIETAPIRVTVKRIADPITPLAGTISASPPTLRMDGTPLAVTEHGGYVLAINEQRFDIPLTTGNDLTYDIPVTVSANDVIKLAFYDSNRRISDFVPVVVL